MKNYFLRLLIIFSFFSAPFLMGASDLGGGGCGNNSFSPVPVPPPPTPTPSVDNTTLSTISNLALAASGNARSITITNSGSNSAVDLSITYPTWPTGTTAESNCGTSLASSATCTIMITPGANATSDCNSPYSAPTPDLIRISASNASAVNTSVRILNYGCIYQGGYIFAIDDSTATDGSIGGTIVSQANQSNGVFWSSNGNAGTPSSSEDIIPGTDESSTPSLGSPTYATAQTLFNSTYSNEGTFPFPSSNNFSACTGANDGACNSSNILELYNNYITNFGVAPFPYTLSAGPTDLATYAAGVCSQYTIDSDGNSPCSTGTCYDHWFLPAICQMGAAGEGAGCASGIENMVTNLQGLIAGCVGSVCLSGNYWSSTEYSGPSVSYRAWDINYFISGAASQDRDGKDNSFFVRCARGF